MVAALASLTYKKCASCREVLDVRHFNTGCKRSSCRRCEAERMRRYRRTAQYRRQYEAWRARPEVQESIRAAGRLRSTRKTSEWKSPRGRLINMRRVARYKARRHEINGNDDAARHQWQRVDMFTREIARIDRQLKRLPLLRGTGQ